MKGRRRALSPLRALPRPFLTVVHHYYVLINPPRRLPTDMEDLPDEDEIDLEALQAQIDLSLAHTKNLVSSWLQPTLGTHPVSSRHKEDKEIQDLLRRPSRLGVGAPIPASVGSLGHETLKLKHKLSGKKRAREDDRMEALTTERSEDEAESRAGAIQKKPRIDPFASKKGKTKRQSDLSKALDNAVSPEQTRKKGSDIRKDGSPARRTQVDHPPPGEIAGPSMSNPQFPQRQLSSNASETSEATPVASHNQEYGNNASHKSPTKTPHTHPEKYGTGASVLNLDGPPAPPDNPVPRKRRKKKKKKKKIGQPSDGVTQ
ncbi:hypothetical protein NLI96_g2580 [Meripilus lineatus]|uniref:Uncharacterized protein n=1 Tax=Meripilus lineatus TaxID=2056292 RepID=A0AAD5V8D8_9APHY|nr:hypothetical protein NLI96_g2580 [Physisporinus lineatus]